MCVKLLADVCLADFTMADVFTVKQFAMLADVCKAEYHNGKRL
jgi:hypothetical protein